MSTLIESALPLATLQTFHPAIGADVQTVLTLRGSLASRNVVGGTAPEQVKAQIARHRARLVGTSGAAVVAGNGKTRVA